MQGWHDAAELTLQILSNPAWSGIGSICSLIGIPLAILLARQSNISKPQELLTARKNQEKLPIPSNETRLFMRDGYHRVSQVKELVKKDVDIMIVLETKRLAS